MSGAVSRVLLPTGYRADRRLMLAKSLPEGLEGKAAAAAGMRLPLRPMIASMEKELSHGLEPSVDLTELLASIRDWFEDGGG